MSAHAIRFIAGLVSLVAVAVLSGCAAAYRPEGLNGGYTDTQVGADTFRVVFRGDSYSSPERAHDLALLRAAEVVHQHGFSFFAILSEGSSPSPDQSATPDSALTSGSVTTDAGGAYFTGHTTYTPGKIYASDEPEAELLVRGFQTKPDKLLSFDVGSVQQSIRQKYGIK